MLLGILDGHGINGQKVSLFLKQNLPKWLDKQFLINKISLESTEPGNTEKIEEIVEEVFFKTNEVLHQNIDTSFSGSTCSVAIINKTNLLSINLGDSRIILGREVNGSFNVIDLTRDHKPNDPEERERIINMKGEVRKYSPDNSDNGTYRICLPNEDIPGLAMTRSFGDKLAEQIGKIVIPEVHRYEFTRGDCFVFAASDGVWEFLSSQEIGNIIYTFKESKNSKECCEAIIKEASSRWIKHENSIDDISMILLFLDNKT